jgi:hypothetical protein
MKLWRMFSAAERRGPNAISLLENADPRAPIGDKACDADSLIDARDRRAIPAVIPPKANRKVKRD